MPFIYLLSYLGNVRVFRSQCQVFELSRNAGPIFWPRNWVQQGSCLHCLMLNPPLANSITASLYVTENYLLQNFKGQIHYWPQSAFSWNRCPPVHSRCKGLSPACLIAVLHKLCKYLGSVSQNYTTVPYAT